MTYTPKPGDRVTSPLLVGEWEVSNPWEHQPSGVVRLLDVHRDAIVYLWPDALVPVVPPLPPEPAVGAVVWARGKFWMRGPDYWWSQTGIGEDEGDEWSELAGDAVPVVPITKVADWMDWRGYTDEEIDDLRREFGWDK